MATKPKAPVSPQTALVQAEIAARVLAQRHLIPFTKRFNPKYSDGWVHRDICRRLERFSREVAEGKSPRLMLLMPPRHGKSELASRSFPAWHLGHHPDHEFIACSYNLSLAMGFSRKVKQIIDDPTYASVFPGTRPDPNNWSTEEWGIAGQRGGYVAAGIGGPITGKGAHCLHPQSKVLTVDGSLDIVHLYHLKSIPDVATPMGPKRVLAATKRPAPQMYVLRFASGAVLRATAEHPIYLPDQGRYATVGELYGQAQNHGVLDLRVVRHGVRASAGRLQQGVAEGAHGLLLQSGVQSGTPRGEERQTVRDMRCPGEVGSEPQREILLSGVPTCTAKNALQDLPSVQRGVSAEAFKAGLLRGGLRGYGACDPYAWGEELELPNGGRIRVLVRPDEAADSGARQRVCGVRSDTGSALSPYRRGEEQQHPGEPGDALRRAPHGASQVCYDTLSVVEPDSECPDFVYDLQVEDAGCFFAEEILVGNCLVIDDPVKNAEEADSADAREKIWEWYLSTAYSRLAPGGGVLIIQCMVGDTPVLLPDGSEQRLDALRAGDIVATYENGRLSSARVAAVKSNGRDHVLKITTISGRVVRANGRHPFLVSDNGELKWIRARSLTTAHKIVACLGSGANGKTQPASQETAEPKSSVAATARPTTTRKNGLTAIAHRLLTPSPVAQPTSNIGTDSPQTGMLVSLMRRAGSALSAATKWLNAHQLIGAVTCASTTATTPTKFVDCSATTATLESDTLELSALHSPWLNTSEFTADQISSIGADGVEEVFDVQIDRTENFIANGLVSHNTWWHDDDLAGKLQTLMKRGSEDEFIDQFEVIKYPAIAEADEHLNAQTDLIEYDVPPELASSPQYTLLRRKGEPLHPERYDLNKLLRIKAQNNGGRWWSALYQQNPVPNDGGYFTKDQFRQQPAPSKEKCNVLIAWDFAISEKKQNDYTVGTVGLQDDDDMLHIVDQLRFKSADAFFIVEAILNLALKWYSSANPAMVIGFEDGQIYRAIESLLKKRMKERQFYPSTVVLKPITDKLARGRVLQGRMQQGMVSFASNAPWFDSLKTEMLRFPAGVHDDQVDSASWMAQLAVGKAAPAKPRSSTPRSWRDKLNSYGQGSTTHMVA